MDTIIRLIAALTLLLASAAAAPSLQPQEWVTVSRCRLQCVNKFLSASGYALTEDVCMSDIDGCFECWKMCENLLAKPLEFDGVCDSDYDANAASASYVVEGSEEDYICADGCFAACDAHDSLDKRFYASTDEPLVAEPLVDFYNSSAMFLNIDVSSDDVQVYVILYRMSANIDDWTQLLSTFQQPIPVYGSFSQYPGLQLRVLSVTTQGVTGDAILDIYDLAAAVTEPSTTTSKTQEPTPDRASTISVIIGTTSATSRTTDVPLAPTALVVQSQYQRMFNHYIDLFSGSESRASTSVDTHASNAASNTVVYISVAVVCVLVLVVVIVGIVVLRSNNKLAKSLSRRASTFRTSFRRSVRRSVRGFRAHHMRYDVARAAENGEAPSENTTATSDALADSNMKPMIVPLLCVSTPNLHAANLLNVSPLKLQTSSLMNIHAVNQSDTPLLTHTPDVTPDIAVSSPEDSAQSDSIVILMNEKSADDSDC